MSEGSGQFSGQPPGNNHLPWHLIPPFRPGETNVNEYTRRLEFLADIWPQEQLALLAPRACLLCEGTAFAKVVRLDASKLKVQSKEGVKLVVKTLGGVWGQSRLETKYERFEKAIFGTVQKPDETNSSYLARHEVQYEELMNMGASLEEMRAYILIRNSGLAPEDKKKIIVDSGGNLEYDKITSALQLLGSKFFTEVQSGTSSKAPYRNKTYDVNYVDEDEPEAEEAEEAVFFSQDMSEDAALEVLLAEGDTDAQLINQFEETIIDSLQGDPEIATCLNAYLEARRKISEKVKGRGFWAPKGSKGSGKGKGKNKGGFKQRFRKPLAQRILESTCRYCNQPGHWRAECPVRLKNANAQAPTGGSAFAGVAMASESHTDDHDEPDENPPEHATAFMTEEICFMTASMNSKGFNQGYKGDNQHQVDKIIHSLDRSSNSGSPWKSQLSRRLQAIVRSSFSEPRLRQHNPQGEQKDRTDAFSSAEVSEECVHFASHGTLGIVDLGASMSVIGERQFQELCHALPKTLLHRMKESPCHVSFRFGNNSTVNGTRAVYFPVGTKWIKVVVVPSNTPFLIANSVFRNLDALIDTGRGEVFFQAIGHRVPMKLSERKLFQIDLLDLLKSNARPHDCSSPGADVMLSEVTGRSVSGDEMRIASECRNQQPERTESCFEQRGKTAENQLLSRLSQRSISTSPEHSPVAHVADSSRDGFRRPVESPETVEHQGERGSQCHSHHHGHDSSGVAGREDRVWQSPHRQAVQRADGRSQIHGMVLRELSTQSQASSCEVSSLHSAVAEPARSHRAECEVSGAQSQGQGAADASDRTGFGGRRGLGPDSQREHCGSGRDAPAGDSDGDDPSRSSESSEGHQPAVPVKESKTSLSSIPPMIVADMCDAWFTVFHSDASDNGNNYGYEDVGDNIILYSRETNWVAREMWGHFASKGIFPDSPMLKRCRADLLEVYCSQNSALTDCASQKGLWAERHGLSDGDLSTWEGRRRLYDRLLVLRPRDIWLAPRCKAWCKWNEFNRHKSPELARRIMQDREADQVHLLLCDALFQFQTGRSLFCHAHLEQPDGSQMLYQEELAEVTGRSWIGRCDMCTAGRLRNPETQNLLKKGTQIVTTSQLMQRQVQKYQCTRDHIHDHVAGSCVVPYHGRMNVSQYSELYTRVFADKVIRSMQCSAQVAEVNRQPDETVLVTRPSDADVTDVPNKRRKLGIKQPPTLEYQKLQRLSEVQQVIDKIKSHAPSVGKRFFFDGPVVKELQQFYPEVTLKCVELCKGADKLRCPPMEITKIIAPFRRTLGIHRNLEGVFEDDQWEEWGKLSKRQLTRHGKPSRLMITLFGSSSSPAASGQVIRSSDIKEHQPSLESLEPEAKRFRSNASEPCTAQPQQSQFPMGESRPEKSHQESHGPNSHGPNFLKLSAEERQQLLRMHNNLGHPDATTLGNVLRDQQWPSTAIEGIKDMHCPACFERQRPRLARPSHLHEPREFNEVVAIDAVMWTDKNNQQFQFYHMIDMSTNFQIAFPFEHRPTSTELSTLITRHWIAWAGPPKTLLHDSAGEFCSEEFGKFLQSYDIRSHAIPGEAHWQLGRCERHGAILQGMLDKWQTDHPILTHADFECALTHLITAKNSLSRHRGYSPEILVLGRSRHVPACLSNEELGPADWLMDENHENYDQPYQHRSMETQAFFQNMAMREQARIAFIRTDHDMKLRRALLKRSRPERQNFVIGQWVMYWRNGKGTQIGTWNGPARVVLTEDRNITWVTHQSRIFRCAPEHLRPLSDRESQFPEVIQQQGQVPHFPLPEQLGSGVFQYQDLTVQSTSPIMPQNIESPPPDEVHNSPDPLQDNIVTDHNPHSITTEQESTNDIQPDAEPAHVPTGPPTPDNQSIPQVMELPAEIPRGGLDVALPATDAEGLVMDSEETDAWSVEGSKLIRYHLRPRFRLFCPAAMDDIPIPMEYLTEDRETHVKTMQDLTWTYHDAWKGNIMAHQRMPVQWTGKTVFTIQDQYVKEIPETILTASCPIDKPRCYEVALTLDVDDVLHCSRQSIPEQIAFLASSAKKQRSEVKERDLSPSDKSLFQTAKTKEIVSWLTTETVRKIARSQIPEDQILRSRWVLTWKPVDESQVTEDQPQKFKPKARLVILGFEDPQIETLARDSPTLGKDSRTLIFQYAASSRWKIQSFDIQTAFLRGSRQDGRILGMEPPQEMRDHMNLKPWECCELLKSAYGLVNAPLLWYEELKGALLALNFVISPLDPCLFALPRKDGKGIHGMVGIHVDDGLGAGDEIFQTALQQLEKRYPFGSKSTSEFVFTGIHINQQWDGTITLDQTKYVEDIPAIDVERVRRQQPDSPITEKERQSLRGLVGSIQYAATNTRPDLSAKLSLLQSKINQACVKDLLEANKLLHEAKIHKHTTVTIKPIPLQDLRFVSFSDAAFANRANSQSQKGCLILAASKTIGEWKASEVSPLIWYSRKISRVVASTLASEAYALSGSVDLLSWLRIQWSWLCQPSSLWKTPERCLQQCPEAYAVVDCKSLYDLIQKTTVPQCQEYRTMLEALIIKDRIKEGIQIKWVHSAAQLADALTKSMDCSTLREFLAKGRCIIHDVDEVLKARADKRSKKAWMDQVATPAAVANTSN